MGDTSLLVQKELSPRDQYECSTPASVRSSYASTTAYASRCFSFCTVIPGVLECLGGVIHALAKSAMEAMYDRDSIEMALSRGYLREQSLQSVKEEQDEDDDVFHMCTKVYDR